MVAFITASLIGIAGCLAVWLYGRRRPVGAPLSWGEAMLAATFVFFMMFWWYGVIPHQWLDWADNELGWRADTYLIQATGSPMEGGWPLDINLMVVRDVIAVAIYGVALGLQILLWALWQGRAKQRPVEVPASRYGRPLVRKG